MLDNPIYVLLPLEVKPWWTEWFSVASALAGAIAGAVIQHVLAGRTRQKERELQRELQFELFLDRLRTHVVETRLSATLPALLDALRGFRSFFVERFDAIGTTEENAKFFHKWLINVPERSPDWPQEKVNDLHSDLNKLMEANLQKRRK